MKRETTPQKVTDKIVELCNMVVSGVKPVYVPVEAAEWSRSHECFLNVQWMVQEQGGWRVNGWAVWQWANILVEAEVYAVWESPEGKRIGNIPCHHRLAIGSRTD